MGSRRTDCQWRIGRSRRSPPNRQGRRTQARRTAPATGFRTGGETVAGRTQKGRTPSRRASRRSGILAARPGRNRGAAAAPTAGARRCFAPARLRQSRARRSRGSCQSRSPMPMRTSRVVTRRSGEPVRRSTRSRKRKRRVESTRRSVLRRFSGGCCRSVALCRRRFRTTRAAACGVCWQVLRRSRLSAGSGWMAPGRQRGQP